jgi:transcriptional regulator with XRE-family HTH domain
MDTTTTMGGRIRAARKAQGLSQERLARLINVSTFSISKYERSAASNPTADTLRDMARELGVSIDWIVNGDGRGPVEAAA